MPFSTSFIKWFWLGVGYFKRPGTEVILTWKYSFTKNRKPQTPSSGWLCILLLSYQYSSRIRLCKWATISDVNDFGHHILKSELVIQLLFCSLGVHVHLEPPAAPRVRHEPELPWDLQPLPLLYQLHLGLSGHKARPGKFDRSCVGLPSCIEDLGTVPK